MLHCHIFLTSARETYDTWLPERWWGPLRAIVQWKCVNCPHWWYLCSAFVRRTILRQLSARTLETYLGAWICLNILPESHSEPQKYQRGHVSTPPFSIHWYAKFSAMGKLARALFSNLWAVCPISTKQAFHFLKWRGKSCVLQIGVVPRKNGIFYFM